jgi:hypothetical protein
MKDTYIPQTGLIPDLPDERDFLYSDLMQASPVDLDWEKGFNAFEDVGILPIEQDQGSSSSYPSQVAYA